MILNMLARTSDSQVREEKQTREVPEGSQGILREQGSAPRWADSSAHQPLQFGVELAWTCLSKSVLVVPLV